jgi:hypothetical protein
MILVRLFPNLHFIKKIFKSFVGENVNRTQVLIEMLVECFSKVTLYVTTHRSVLAGCLMFF